MTTRANMNTTKTVDRDAPTLAPPLVRPARAALGEGGPIGVAATRALDVELGWYFAYAESALHREDVGMLPSYAAIRVQAADMTDERFRVLAQDLARTVRGCLHLLPAKHASVLRSAYTPRQWPKGVLKAFDSLAPIVVRLCFADDPWPARSSHTGLEDAVATRLSAALSTKAAVPVARLRTQAQRLLGNAVLAYFKARSPKAPSLTP